MERWTRFVLRFRFIILALWIGIAVLGAVATPQLSKFLTTSLAVPHSESDKANEILTRVFGENVEGLFTVIYEFKQANPAQLAEIKSRVTRAARVIPGSESSQQRALGGVLYSSIQSSLNLNQAGKYTQTLREALQNEGLSGAMVTGPPALAVDLQSVLNRNLRIGSLIALVCALIVLLLLFGRTWAVLIPFLVAGATTAGSICLVYLLAHQILMVLYIPNVVELIGLGLAIDYSLLIVHRFRQEVSESDVDAAILRTMQTAGRTVILSSLTVAAGLISLLIVPISFLRSLGLAGLIVPMISVVVALSLQPIILKLLGRSIANQKRAGLVVREKFWSQLIEKISHRPRVTIISAFGVLLIFAAPIIWMQLTPTSMVAIPHGLESTDALTSISKRIGSGVVTPHEIVIDLGASGLADTDSVTRARDELARTILRDSSVFAVATDTVAPYVDKSGRHLRLLVIGRDEFGSMSSQELVRNLRKEYLAHSHFPSGTRLYLGGAPAQGVDFLAVTNGTFPWIVVLVLFLLIVIIFRAFKSWVLAFLTAGLNLVSMIATFGVLTLISRFGILGNYRLDQIEGWVPIFLFAVLFGLSIDYQVFILSRIREFVSEGNTLQQATIEGVTKTGGLVTSAALIFMIAVAGLAFGDIAGLQELGIGLALGVLIDVTIVRSLLLPSTLLLLQ